MIPSKFDLTSPKNRGIKKKINETIDELIDLKKITDSLLYQQRHESYAEKASTYDKSETHRFTVQSMQHQPNDIRGDEDDAVPMGTVEEYGDTGKLVRVKCERGWEVVTRESWEKGQE